MLLDVIHLHPVITSLVDMYVVVLGVILEMELCVIKDAKLQGVRVQVVGIQGLRLKLLPKKVY